VKFGKKIKGYVVAYIPFTIKKSRKKRTFYGSRVVYTSTKNPMRRTFYVVNHKMPSFSHKEKFVENVDIYNILLRERIAREKIRIFHFEICLISP
jgi:hypothetical protein